MQFHSVVFQPSHTAVDMWHSFRKTFVDNRVIHRSYMLQIQISFVMNKIIELFSQPILAKLTYVRQTHCFQMQYMLRCFEIFRFAVTPSHHYHVEELVLRTSHFRETEFWIELDLLSPTHH